MEDGSTVLLACDYVRSKLMDIHTFSTRVAHNPSPAAGLREDVVHGQGAEISLA